MIKGKFTTGCLFQLIIFILYVDIYLEDSKQRYGKGVEVGRWRSPFKVELSAKQLHAEKCEDENEQEEQEQQWNDGPHRIQEWYHKVPERGPIFCDL